MKPQYENPSFLNAQKIKLHTIYHSNSEVSSKKNIRAGSPRKKHHKPIVSFLNFSKNKILSTSQNEPQVSISGLVQKRKEEENFEFHEFQEDQNNESQIGSQYGQKNYDNELKQVLKKQRRPLRKQYRTPKVSLRINSQQKENFEQFSSKYERFQKFQTQMQKKDSSIKQELSNQTSNLQAWDNKKWSGFCPYSQKVMHRAKTQLNSKHQECFTDTEKLEEQQQKKQLEHIPEQDNENFKHFKVIDSTTTFQAIEFKKVDKNISPSHRRSRTQEDLPSKDNEKAEHIFQNYHKLKKNLFKSPKHQDHFLNDYLKPTTPTSIQLCEKEKTAQESHSKLRKDNNKNYRSLPKCQPLTVSQNIYCINLPSSRGVTPKSLTRKNIDEKKWTKMIKQRKKDYFEKTDKSFELSNFTFDQIKQKLMKLEINEAKKTHNKSHMHLGKKNALLYSELFVNGQKTKQDEDDHFGKQKSIKFKGIAFKANLIRKHTDIYEKHVKKMAEKNLSVKVTPKVSQSAIQAAI